MRIAQNQLELHLCHTKKFVHLECAGLSEKMSGTKSELERVSKMQDEKAIGDAFGVFLLGIPFSNEGEVARLKGEGEALKTAQIKKQVYTKHQ